jgi:hypothetical protein
MRHLVVFVLRLWVDSESNPASYEGQMEYIATGERTHIRTEKDVIHFIHTHTNPNHGEGNPLNGDGDPSGDSQNCPEDRPDSLQ